jgi:hypothetical protein
MRDVVLLLQIVDLSKRSVCDTIVTMKMSGCGSECPI